MEFEWNRWITTEEEGFSFFVSRDACLCFLSSPVDIIKKEGIIILVRVL